MQKKIMLIINPCAGRRKGKKNAGKATELFEKNGCDCTLFLTGKRGDATEFVMDRGMDFDVIACMGGDGTLNEVINGLVKSNLDRPLGYIPAGSTNDFARSMGLSKKLEDAVANIAEGNEKRIDVGLFNDRYFSYISSFGLFTRTSYRTSQRVKNLIGGRLSYFLHGFTELFRIRKEHMVVETGGRRYEDDFLFGAVSNSTSIGGLLKYDPEQVDACDGMLEVLLIRCPKNPVQLFSVLKGILTKSFGNHPLIVFDRSDRITVHPSKRSDWSLDGEFAYSTGSCEIKCLRNRLRFIAPSDEQ
jgi:lipid kinase, YegS/Rv2252/BmrU family